MTIERFKEELGYESKPELWQKGFDALLERLAELIKESDIRDKKGLQNERQSCRRLKELLDAEIPIIIKHLETHKWLRQIPDASQGMIDFIEQYGWLMRDMYCHSACPDRSTCGKI